MSEILRQEDRVRIDNVITDRGLKTVFNIIEIEQGDILKWQPYSFLDNIIKNYHIYTIRKNSKKRIDNLDFMFQNAKQYILNYIVFNRRYALMLTRHRLLLILREIENAEDRMNAYRARNESRNLPLISKIEAIDKYRATYLPAPSISIVKTIQYELVKLITIVDEYLGKVENEIRESRPDE